MHCACLQPPADMGMPCLRLQVCNDCFTISGPQNATVEYFNQAPSTASSYQLFINWDPAYQGPITVGLAK